MVEEVRAGRGYQSHYGSRYYFGLGKANTISQIEVLWPNGKKEAFGTSAGDKHLTLIEGEGN